MQAWWAAARDRLACWTRTLRREHRLRLPRQSRLSRGAGCCAHRPRRRRCRSEARRRKEVARALVASEWMRNRHLTVPAEPLRQARGLRAREARRVLRGACARPFDLAGRRTTRDVVLLRELL